MIAKAAFLVFALIAVGWLYVLTFRCQQILDHAEALVDRQHGPALPPEPVRPVVVIDAEPAPTQPDLPAQPRRPRPHPDPLPPTVPSHAVITPEAFDTRISDVKCAEVLAHADNDLIEMRKEWEKL